MLRKSFLGRPEGSGGGPGVVGRASWGIRESPEGLLGGPEALRGGLGGLLGGSWTLLGLILPRFFAFVFNFDFLSIFFRFWMGFESVLGGQNGRKIEIFGIFLNMLVETLFLVEIC